MKLPQSDIDELAQRLRDWLAFDAAQSPAGQRDALRRIEQELQAAARVIREGFSGGVDITDETPLKAAWRLIHAATRVARLPYSPLTDAEPVITALTIWSAAAAKAHAAVPKTRGVKSALLMLADAVVSRVRHHGGKVSSYKNGETVTALMSVYKAAGARLTRDAAVKAIKGQIRRRKSVE
jgi:hypothetical protein